MITNEGSSLLSKKFSLSAPWEMQREPYGKYEYQCQGVYGSNLAGEMLFLVIVHNYTSSGGSKILFNKSTQKHLRIKQFPIYDIC